jgi:N-acetyl-gamma-glutamyl-phosphate reductase
MAHAPTLLSRGVRVIDLAADFRLADATRWAEWYGMEHACPDLLSEAVYGLPELNRSAIRQARLVANPGCYPTAVTLGLLPLLSAKAIKPGRIIADAKSGVSGAGRKASAAMLMAEVGESFKAYSATGHRHHPEIVQTLSEASGGPIGLTFVPHLVPMVRGIEATLYADVADGFGDDLQALMEAHYDEEPFVDVMAAGSHPETRSVRGTNTCRLSVLTPYSGDVVVVQSVIDNLVKGAAGQAVHNMNLMFGLDEVLGLGQVALSP